MHLNVVLQDRLKREQKELESMRSKFGIGVAGAHGVEIPFSMERQELENLRMELKTMKLKEEISALAGKPPIAMEHSARFGGNAGGPLNNVDFSNVNNFPQNAWTNGWVGPNQNNNSMHFQNNNNSNMNPNSNNGYYNSTIDTERLDRLLREKQQLMSTGMYTEDHFVIRKLNDAIDQTQNPLLHTANGNTTRRRM